MTRTTKSAKPSKPAKPVRAPRSRAGTRTAGAGLSPVASLAQFAARSRARRGLRARPLLVLVGLVMLAGGVAWVAYASPYLATQRIEVVGVRAVSAETVRELAEPELGTPLAGVDTAQVAHRVARLPRIATVRAVRSWPDTLRVEVTERRAVAVLTDGRGFRLVDRTGVAFARTDGAPNGVPLLLTAGPPARQRAALAVLSALPAAFAAEVRSVRADSVENITLVLRDGATVRWGSVERSVDKATVVTALRRQGGRLYDVSAVEAPSISG